MSRTRDFGNYNKWEGTGNWKIIDCSWDRDNSSGKYKLGAEMGYIKTGEKGFFGEKTKLVMQSIVVKHKVGIFKTEDYFYTSNLTEYLKINGEYPDKVTGIKEISQEEVRGKSFTGKAVAGGVGYLFLGPVGLAAGALSAGNNSLKEKKASFGIEFSDGNWLVVEFDLQESRDVNFMSELLNTDQLEKKSEKPF